MKKLPLAIAVASSLLGTYGASAQPAPSDPRVFIFSAPAEVLTDVASFFVAADLGYFKDAGVDFRFKTQNMASGLDDFEGGGSHGHGYALSGIGRSLTGSSCSVVVNVVAAGWNGGVAIMKARTVADLAKMFKDRPNARGMVASLLSSQRPFLEIALEEIGIPDRAFKPGNNAARMSAFTRDPDFPVTMTNAPHDLFALAAKGVTLLKSFEQMTVKSPIVGGLTVPCDFVRDPPEVCFDAKEKDKFLPLTDKSSRRCVVMKTVEAIDKATAWIKDDKNSKEVAAIIAKHAVTDKLMLAYAKSFEGLEYEAGEPPTRAQAITHTSKVWKKVITSQAESNYTVEEISTSFEKLFVGQKAPVEKVRKHVCLDLKKSCTR